MKKIIQFLVIIILLAIVAIIVIVVFNPMNLRTKLVGGIINSYLSQNIKNDAAPENLPSPNNSTDKNPLLNEEQEKTLENLGVDVSLLPTEITPAMQECFVEKIGKDRAEELVKGEAPSPLEIIKSRECLIK